ncbi:hypothetical protein [Embleya sp. NPDC001921]
MALARGVGGAGRVDGKREDRWLTLANAKRMGHLLDPEGRSTGFVRMDIWA